MFCHCYIAHIRWHVSISLAGGILFKTIWVCDTPNDAYSKHLTDIHISERGTTRSSVCFALSCPLFNLFQILWVVSDAPSHTLASYNPCSQLWSLLVLASYEVLNTSCMFLYVSYMIIFSVLWNSLIQRFPLQRQECQDSRDWAGAGSCQKRPPSDRGLSDQGEERGGIWEELRRLLMNNISLRKVKYIACKQKLNLKYIYKIFLLKGEERQRNSQPFGSGRAPKCDIRKATRWKGRNALSHVHWGDFLFINKNLHLLVLRSVWQTTVMHLRCKKWKICSKTR